MKNTISLILAILLLLLAGCSDKPDSPANASGDSSEPYALRLAPEDYNQAGGLSFFETPEAVYCQMDDKVFFCPQGGDAFRPLCGKPNCLHDGRNCNAWCGWSEIGYYDGALYAAGTSQEIDGGLDIIRMNLDGTDHKVVFTLNDSRLDEKTITWTFHRGKLFVLGRDDDIGQPQGEQMDCLLAVDLADYSVSELAADYLSGARLSELGKFYKDKLFGLSFDLQTMSDNVAEIDIVTGEAHALISEYIGGLYATDSTLYYYVPDVSYLGVEQKTDVGFREYDLQSGTVKSCATPLQDIQYVQYDEDYVYAGSYPVGEKTEKTRVDRVLYFLSRDYQLVDQIEMNDGLMMAAVTHDKIFFFLLSTDCITCYLDRAQIGSGNLQLIPIETIG